MDELEKLLAFVDTEVELIEGLEQISKIEVRHPEDLDNWANNILCTLEDEYI